MFLNPSSLLIRAARQLEQVWHQRIYSGISFSETVQVLSRRSYGAHPSQTLDIFRPRTAQKLPLVILLPGFYFCSMDSQSMQGYIQHLTNNGYAVALVHHRQAPEHLYPEQLRDVSIAFRWLHQKLGNFRLRPIFFLHGFNSGANLILNYINALQHPFISEAFELETNFNLDSINGCALSDGIYDFDVAPFQTKAWQPSKTSWILGRTDQHAMRALASPAQHLGEATPPIYLSNSKNSILLPQFLALKNSLEQQNYNYKFGSNPNATLFFDSLLHKDKIYPLVTRTIHRQEQAL